MRTRRQRNPYSQIIVGLFVIGMGLVFLLDNLGWLDFNFTIHLWPSLLMLAGVLKVMQTRSVSGIIIGGALIVVGSLFMLTEMGYLFLSWKTLWPVLMIAAGLSVIFKSSSIRAGVMRTDDPSQTPFQAPRPQKGTDDSVIEVTAIMGGYERRVTSQDFRGGEITAIMGGCDLDLRQSSINGEAVLNVFAAFGGIQIKVPSDWTVVLQGVPIMGGFGEKTIQPPDASKRLIIQGYAILGGIDVRN